MDSCPKELEPYEIAHKKKLFEQDCMNYLWWREYGISALMVAIEPFLSSKKPKQKYADKPILKKIEEENKPLSEEELQRQRELFVAKLEVMKANFDSNHKKEN